MDIADILKIVVPVIVALCSTVWATIRWTYDRDVAAQKAYWKVVHETLLSQMGEHRTQHESWQVATDERMLVLDKDITQMRIKVAEEYVKRSDWLEQEKSVERKLDQLRIDISKELQKLSTQVAELRGAT